MKRNTHLCHVLILLLPRKILIAVYITHVFMKNRRDINPLSFFALIGTFMSKLQEYFITILKVVDTKK